MKREEALKCLRKAISLREKMEQHALAYIHRTFRDADDVALQEWVLFTKGRTADEHLSDVIDELCHLDDIIKMMNEHLKAH